MKPEKYIHILLFLLSIVLLYPYLTEPNLVIGQLSKQSFVAEMVRSFLNGESQGLFANRHFLEPHHPGVVPWAEELPLYVISIVSLAKLTGLSIVIIGRFLSFCFFLFLLAGAWLLGKALKFGYFLPLLLVLFPIFRIYSVLVMPELPMATFCLWAMLFAYQEQWGKTALMLGFAVAMKYYAVFCAFGILLYFTHLQFHRRKDWRDLFSPKAIKFYFLLFIAILPTLAYLFYFLHLGIPNPIQEYRALSGIGHFASLQYLLSAHFYARLFTWNFIKNPTIIGAIIAILGFYYCWKKRERHMNKYILFLTQIAANALFMLIFASSFFVHDYYGIQFALVMVIFAAYGIAFLKGILPEKHADWYICAVLILLAIASEARVRSALSPQTYFKQVAEVLQKYTQKESQGIFIMDGYGEAALWMADRTAWMVSDKEWHNFPSIQKDTEKLVKEFTKSVQQNKRWVGILLLGNRLEEIDMRFAEIYERVRSFTNRVEVCGRHNFLFPAKLKHELNAKFWLFDNVNCTGG